MTTLYLHLGTYKTGSSRIQHEAWRQRDTLPAQGWLYPRTGLATTSPEVGQRHAFLVYDHRYRPELWPGHVKNLADEIRFSGAGNVLLSSEAWSLPYAAEILSEMVASLRDANAIDEMVGLIYLRNRYDYARSMYREMTRRRQNVRPFQEWIALRRQRRMFDPLGVVRRLSDAVGAGNLRAFSYETCGDIGAHFFGQLGLNAAPAEQWTNPGLDALEVEAYRQVKLIDPELRDFWPGLDAVTSRDRWPVDAAEHFPAEEFTPTSAWRREFQNLTGWSNEHVERLVAPPASVGPNVLDYSDDVRSVVESWAASAASA